MIQFIFTILVFLFAELKTLDLLYRFQIKEYRLDRFAAMVRDNGFVQVFFKIEKLPAKTPRNLLSVMIATFLLVLWTVIVIGSTPLLAMTFVMYWLIAFFAAGAGIILSAIPSFLKKTLAIFRAASRIRKLHPVVIGITGSFGKTTTKDYLADILSQKFRTAKTRHNMNTDAGVAISILDDMNDDTEVFIAEMGAYRKGEIRDICRMTGPRYAIITAIGNQHLHLFGSRDNLVDAKKELLQSLPKDGAAWVNTDRAPYDRLKAGIKATVVPYHLGDRDLRNLSGYALPPEVIKENLIPCILLARALGLTEKEINAGILAVKSKRHRMTPETGRNGVTVIDNSYNTNREGCIYSLGVLNGRREKTKILVTRGIIELGPEKKETYAAILHVLAKTGVLLYTTDADFKESGNPNVRVFADEAEMLHDIRTCLHPGTVVLLEGRINKEFTSFLKPR